ncbi:MAG: AMP-binding protein [Rhodospirillales bacterium]|nr:AMP-binding protein [Rhodospirillales bacterium]
MDLLDWIERHAGFTPDKLALTGNGLSLSYAQLALHAQKSAGMLAELGIGRGDRVVWLGLNAPEMLSLLFGCARLGAILVPINWRLAAPEITYIIKDCAPGLLVADPDFIKMAPSDLGPRSISTGDSLTQLHARAQPVASRQGSREDGVVICYTSGTTGQPKGALLTQEALQWNAVNSTHMHALSQNDRVLTTLPLFHVGGMNIQTLPALHAGASVHLHAKFDPEVCLKTLAQERITLTVLVPTQLHALMALPNWQSADLSSLRMISTGSTIVPVPLVQSIFERGIPLVQVYGSTETAPIAAYQTPDGARTRPGSTGKAALHCQLRVIDNAGRDVDAGTDGEILVRGPNLMRGYWKDEAATARALQDGWFHTGDVGHVDADGFLIVSDRKKDMIISGGENIYPAQLEMVMAECPEIQECAVVGRKDPHWGEVAVAVVVRRLGARITEGDVMRLFQDRVARYKHPRAVIFVDQLPRNAMGKIVKGDVRKMAMNEEQA